MTYCQFQAVAVKGPSAFPILPDPGVETPRATYIRLFNFLMEQPVLHVTVWRSLIGGLPVSQHIFCEDKINFYHGKLLKSWSCSSLQNSLSYPDQGYSSFFQTFYAFRYTDNYEYIVLPCEFWPLMFSYCIYGSATYFHSVIYWRHVLCWFIEMTEFFSRYKVFHIRPLLR